MMKNYLNDLACACSEELFGQEAVEWAIMKGLVKLTYDQESDLKTIMGIPGFPDTGMYDQIIEDYQLEIRGNREMLVESYAPLLEQFQMFAKEAA